MALAKSVRNSYKESVRSGLTIPQYFARVIKPELEEYYSDYNSDWEDTPVIKCPLHTEDTPSCRYYPDTESFYCFGCGRGGDVISLHRYFIESLTGVKPNFDDSLEYLYKRFVEGRQIEAPASKVNNFAVAAKEEVKQLSTDVELMRMARYIKDLEGQLTADTSVALDTKIKLYRAIDLAQNLVERNIVGASTAVHWLGHEKTNILIGRV